MTLTDETGCVACTVFTKLDTLSLSFAREAFDATSGTMALWLNGFMTLWLVWFFIQMMVQGRASGADFIYKLALFLLGFIFLNTGALWMEWIVFPVRDAVTAMAVKIVSISGATNASGFPELIQAVEHEVFSVLRITEVIWEGSRLVTAIYYVAWIWILNLPYLFAWFLFIGFLLEAVFKFMAITAIGPFVVGAAMFKQTRNFATESMKIFVSGATGILFMAVAMGFSISIIQEYVGQIPTIDGKPVLGNVEDFLDSTEYWAMLLVGCLAVLFHIIARQMATAVAGVMDSQIASQAMMGGGALAASAAGSMARRGMRHGSGLGQAGIQAGGQGLARGASKAWSGGKSAIGWGGPGVNGGS